MAEALRETLRERRGEEIARGVTVAGPHRDDLAFAVGETDLRRFGSRGQQRSAAIALKLAEALLLSENGDAPAILLDDVLSELDGGRRDFLADKVVELGQVLLTTTDLDQVPIAYRRGAQIVTVRRADVASLTLEGVA
jgi:DNA replication and repair protein RecF